MLFFSLVNFSSLDHGSKPEKIWPKGLKIGLF